MRKLIYVLALLLIVAAISAPFIFAVGDFSITASPTSGTVAPGGSASTTVTASPTGGFSGPVTLSASISPSSTEISTSFSKNPLNPSTGAYGYTYPDSAVLTVTTTSNVASGTYTVTITGTSGSLSHSTSVTIQVSTQGTSTTTSTSTTTTTLPSGYGTTSSTSTTLQSGQTATIVVKSAPSSVAAPGELLTFSWDVTGTGSIIHTAVHWDTKPGNPTDFNSYGHFTLEFADISPADQAPKTYTVSFNAPTAAGTIYYVIHAIVGDQHIYISGGERTIVIQATATTATSTTATTPSTTAPTAAAPGVNPLLVGGVAAIVVIAVAAAIILRRR